MVRSRYRLSLVFRLSPVYSKFEFSAVIQLFGLKITSHGKPDLKNSYSRSDLRHGEVQGEVGVQSKKLNNCRVLELAANRAEPENQADLVSGPDHDPPKFFSKNRT